MSNQTKNRRAFTLLELLIVIVIIGVLAAVLLRHGTKAREAGWATQCKANLRSLYQASLNYAVVNNSGPPANPYETRDRAAEILTNHEIQVTFTYNNHEGWVTWVRRTGPSTPAASLWPSSSSQSENINYPTCYGTDAQYSIQQGALWEYMDGALRSYVCPKFRDLRVQPNAMRSYAMTTNMSGSSPLAISTEASRTILYAELQPWTRDPRWSSPPVCNNSADGLSAEGNNGVLVPGTTPPTSALCDESIGFIHAMSGVYCGHVVFCDGHVDAVSLDKVGASWTNRTYDACNGRF